MSKIYDIAFRMGVLFNILLFTILNVLSYKIAENEIVQRQIERESSEMEFSFGVERMYWGFPFAWDEKISVIEGAGAILNVVISAFCAFAFGFLFKFVWSKISSRGIEVK